MLRRSRCDMPGLSGAEVCRRLRQDHEWVPVLVLTARATLPDRISGLDGGAENYLTKPFHLAELFARLRGLIWRGPATRSPCSRSGICGWTRPADGAGAEAVLDRLPRSDRSTSDDHWSRFRENNCRLG